MKIAVIIGSLICLSAQAKYQMVWDQESAEYKQVDVRVTDNRVRMTDFDTGETSYGRVNDSGRGYVTDIYSNTTRMIELDDDRVRVRKF